MAPKAHPTWFAFIRWLVKSFFFKPLGGFRSVGTENIPMTGPVLFASIHVSHVDPPAVACGCKRRLRFMAKKELFDKKLFGWLIRSLGSFPVSRGESDMQSIRISMELLEQGEALLIFPEGGRNDGETMNPLSKGVAMLAKKNDVPVIPVGLIGAKERLPKGSSKVRRSKMIVAYGEPFTYSQVSTGATEKQNREIFCQELANRIAGLCNAHGFPIKTADSAQLQNTELTPESVPVV